MTLEKEFTKAMFDLYQRTKTEEGYTSSRFFGMLDDGGLAVANNLINRSQPSDGYTALYLRGRLDLTVEAVVVDNPKWHQLFSPIVLEIARKRLKAYRYVPRRTK